MTIEDSVKVAAAIVVSLGGSSALILALTNWLGKVWAEKLMARETAAHDRELATLRSELERQNQIQLSELQTNLEIHRETLLKSNNDKIAIYRLAVDIISEFLADIHKLPSDPKLAGEVLERFNRGRLKAHGYLAMHAPQSVMDEYDEMVDGIFGVVEKPSSDRFEDWKKLRIHAYKLLNAVRQDVAIDKSQIEYRGKR